MKYTELTEHVDYNGEVLYYTYKNGRALTPEQLRYNQMVRGLNYKVVRTEVTRKIDCSGKGGK